MCTFFCGSASIYTVSQKSIPNILDCNLKTNCLILIILGSNILTQLAIKCPFSFPPHPTFVSALPGENNLQNTTFYPMRYDWLINITHKKTFCSHFWHFGWQFIQLSILRLPTVKLLEVLAHYANTCDWGKETLSPFNDSSIDNVLLQTNPGHTSRFFTSQTFLNFIW